MSPLPLPPFAPRSGVCTKWSSQRKSAKPLEKTLSLPPPSLPNKFLPHSTRTSCGEGGAASTEVEECRTPLARSAGAGWDQFKMSKSTLPSLALSEVRGSLTGGGRSIVQRDFCNRRIISQMKFAAVDTPPGLPTGFHFEDAPFDWVFAHLRYWKFPLCYLIATFICNSCSKTSRTPIATSGGKTNYVFLIPPK